MNARIDIKGSEARLREVGETVAEMCRRAGVAQTTWHRWKAKGHQPRESSRRAIIAALDELAPVHAAGGEREAA